ncbi:MAG: ATP-dependent Clp protease ATP-binding subunit [Patescibacteria group bacterium]
MPQDIIDKFSSHLKNVLTRALCFVVETEQSDILPEHLLWSLGTEKGSVGAEVLNKAKIDVQKINKTIDKKIKKKNRQPQLSTAAKRAIEKAVLTANIYEHRYIGTEHLLSGLMQINYKGIKDFLAEEKSDERKLRSQLAIVLKSTSKFPDIAQSIAKGGHDIIHNHEELTDTIIDEEDFFDERKTPALDYFGRDITTQEAQESIDPVIGRDAEINRLMEILCRRTKNNPLLIGEPGVGKTAVVEGLAKMIYENKAPAPLSRKRIITLDLSLLIAGTMYRGEFEGRLRQVIEEARKDSRIVLFIDEVHMISGAGASTGSLDAANMLKPALAKGEIRCIGATTPGEYKKHIETDSALERRFQTILIDEPTQQKTIDILHGIVPFYESFHGVHITKSAIEAAVRLSSRYIQNKKLPDKAIDLIDEAASAARIHSSEPGHFEQIQLVELALEEAQDNKRRAVVEEKFDEAQEYKKEEDQLRQALETSQKEPPRMGNQSITDIDIAKIISKLINIPQEDIMQFEGQRYTDLEEILESRVLGQKHVISTVAGALRRAKSGVAHPNRPMASFLFMGPSGVGKTELAKAITHALFKSDKELIRLDMSEYSESFTMSKLIGAPAGYVGYRDDAKLTDKVKQKPHSVVLFDELEKAHSDIQNLLLQILEEGEATDATGKTIDFRNTIVVITTNAGSEKFLSGNIGFSSGKMENEVQLVQDAKKELADFLRPELVNRIDHTCVFNPLSEATLEQIVQKNLDELSQRIQEQDILLDIQPAVTKFLSAQIDKNIGARDIRRLIQKELETKISEKLLSKKRPHKLSIEKRQDKIHIREPRQK